MQEIQPGVWDWSVVHEKWGITIHSRGLMRALARILKREFRHLTFAHGEPILDEGRERLRAFVGPS